MTPAAVRQTNDGETHVAVINLEAVEEGFSSLQFEISADELELKDKFYMFPRPFRVTLDVSCASNTFGFRGRIEAEVRGDCCRCLAPVEEAVAASIELLVQRKEASAEELEAIAEEEIVRIVDPGTQEFDLREPLRDGLSMELPIRVFCDADCKGLCSTCGQNLNEVTCECTEETSDPRWEALAKLRHS
jgi:uncharacterized protein